jgi:hypothetical protein
MTQCGRICMAPHKITLSTVFAGQKVGVKQVGQQIWLVSFMGYDLGVFDVETTRREPIANAFEPKVPCARVNRYLCDRNRQTIGWPRLAVDASRICGILIRRVLRIIVPGGTRWREA